MTRIRVTPVILGMLCLFLAGCKMSDQSPTAVPGGTTKVDRPVASGSNNPSGPTDGVGGNGIAGKVYESYKIDPRTLKAYQEILQPIFSHLNKIDTVTYGTGDESRPTIPLEEYLKIKTWYLIPSSLKSLDTKTLGVQFVDEKTQQFALQTETEVWIDKNLFENMKLEDQAQLLLHEYFMTLYTNKFRDPVELCKKSEVFKKNICDQTDLGARQQYQYDAYRPLQEQDYQNVRRATAFVFANGTQLLQGEFDELMQTSGFYPEKTQVEKTTAAVAKNEKGTERQLQMVPIPFQQHLERAQAEGKPFDLCHFPDLNKNQACRLEVTKIKDFQNYATYELKILMADSEPMRIIFIQGKNPSPIGSLVYMDASVMYNLTVLPEARVNAIYASVFNHLKPLSGVDLSTPNLSMADFDVKAITIKPNIVRNVRPPPYAGALPQCSFSALTENTDSVVIISSKMSDKEKHEWIKKSTIRSSTEHGDVSCEQKP